MGAYTPNFKGCREATGSLVDFITRFEQQVRSLRVTHASWAAGRRPRPPMLLLILLRSFTLDLPSLLHREIHVALGCLECSRNQTLCVREKKKQHRGHT